MAKELTLRRIEAYEKAFREKKELEVATNAARRSGLREASVNDEALKGVRNIFSIDVEAGDITNQRQSGRCWMFAGLNIIRPILAKKLNVKSVELSEAYLQFYDKLEKANFFLERIIELRNEKADSRLNSYVINFMTGDGGHFRMWANLVKKYGVIPHELMPDNVNAKNTLALNALLQELLGSDAKDLRNYFAKGGSLEGASKKKEKMLQDIYQLLAISLGIPPKSFVYEYKDKDGKFVRLEEMTPQRFYEEYIGLDLDEYMPLCDVPVEGWEKGKIYTTHYFGGIEGQLNSDYFQVGTPEMKKAVVRSLKEGEVVWFGADVSAQSLAKDGYLVNDSLAYGKLLGLDFPADKADRLAYGISSCNHAMTFTGVNIDEAKKPNRWKVANSWGKDNGLDGYFIMDDAWFDEFVYSVYVNKKYVRKDIVEAYEKAKVVDVPPFAAVFMAK